MQLVTLQKARMQQTQMLTGGTNLLNTQVNKAL